MSITISNVQHSRQLCQNISSQLTGADNSVQRVGLSVLRYIDMAISQNIDLIGDVFLANIVLIARDGDEVLKWEGIEAVKGLYEEAFNVLGKTIIPKEIDNITFNEDYTAQIKFRVMNTNFTQNLTLDKNDKNCRITQIDETLSRERQQTKRFKPA